MCATESTLCYIKILDLCDMSQVAQLMNGDLSRLFRISSLLVYSWLFDDCRKFILLTDTGEDSKLVHRRKWTRYFFLFFSTRPSDEYDSASGRKKLASTFGHFRLYRLK